MKKLLIIISMVLSLSMVASPLYASAASLFEGAKGEACQGAGIGQGCDAAAGTKTQTIVKNALNIFSAIIGVIAVVMIMIGGISYITSQGEPAKTATAKNTLLYAAIGLVIVALSQVFVQFVLKKFAG